MSSPSVTRSINVYNIVIVVCEKNILYNILYAFYAMKYSNSTITIKGMQDGGRRGDNKEAGSAASYTAARTSYTHAKQYCPPPPPHERRHDAPCTL